MDAYAAVRGTGAYIVWRRSPRMRLFRSMRTPYDEEIGQRRIRAAST
jgi:hypothetical protein